MTQSDDDSTRARVLDLIAEKGPVSAAQLAKVLSLTPAAVRRHITALEDAEQIEVHTPALTGKRGRGRPARHYVLTPKARTSFAEGYSDLANRALHYLSQVAGDKAVDSFAAARGRDLERRYATVVEAAGKPRQFGSVDQSDGDGGAEGCAASGGRQDRPDCQRQRQR